MRKAPTRSVGRQLRVVNSRWLFLLHENRLETNDESLVSEIPEFMEIEFIKAGTSLKPCKSVEPDIISRETVWRTASMMP